MPSDTLTDEPMTLSGIDIVRAHAATVELRDADPAPDPAGQASLGTLAGHFSTFGDWYEVNSYWEGHFLEQVARGAFAKTIAERRSLIKVLFNHGHDMTVHDKVLGPIDQLREDSTGPYYEVPLFDTSYNRDLVPGLRAGVYGSSFRFEVLGDSWNREPDPSEHNPDGLPERTITEVRLHEFGPVTFPANPAATAGMRGIVSMTDAYYDHLRTHQPDTFGRVEARAKSLRTPAGPSQGTTGAATTTQEPERDGHHSSGMSPAQRQRHLALLDLGLT